VIHSLSGAALQVGRVSDTKQRTHALQAPWPAGRHSCAAGVGVKPEAVKLTLDLHDIYNRSDRIDAALGQVIDEAVQKRAKTVEIIPGKGSGQLKKRVLRYLDQKEVKALYHRVEKDSDNYGRIFVHFRWK
jgi:Smr domain